MIETIVQTTTSPEFIFAVLVSVAVFATLLTLLTSVLGGSQLKNRMP